MIRLLGKVSAVSFRDLLLLAEAFACVAGMRLALWLVPFRYFRRAPRVAACHEGNTDRLAWAVLAACALVPKSTCFVRALAAQRLYARHGYASELQIGVDKPNSSGFSAHAWLDLRGETVIGSPPLGRFTPLFSLTSESHT